MRSLPEETFLLFTRPEGTQLHTKDRHLAVAAAAVAELVLRKRVQIGESAAERLSVVPREDVTPATEPASGPVTDPSSGPVTDPSSGSSPARPLYETLHTYLTRCDGQKLRAVIRHEGQALEGAVGRRLVADGVLTQKEGWFRTTWPATDGAVREEIRGRLAGALREPETASLQDAYLLGTLRSMQAGYVMVQDVVPEMRRRQVLDQIDALTARHPMVMILNRLRAEWRRADNQRG